MLYETQVKTLQASLNKSLCTAMHVYGHSTVLLSNTGIPPLYITQNLQLAQLGFRLYFLPPLHHPAFPLVLMAATATSSAFRYAEVHMQIALGQVDPPRMDLSSLMPHNVTLFKVHDTKSTSRLNVLTNAENTSRLH